MTPKFSIIIPTYNRAKMLSKTILRVQAQDIAEWRLIIVDDGSTDNTRKIVEDAMRSDERIQYVYQENAGQSTARQNGLEHAETEWVTYVDSDDLIYPYYLTEARDFIRANPRTIFATAFMDRTLELHDSAGLILESIEEPPTEIDPFDIYIEDYANWDIKPCGTGIFHKRQEVIDAGVKWNMKIHMLEDLDFLLQLATAFPDGFGYIPEPIFHYVQTWTAEDVQGAIVGVCSGASYADYANAFERIYNTYGTAHVMRDQQWYPEKVNQYKKNQVDFEAGKIGAPYTRIFKKIAD